MTPSPPLPGMTRSRYLFVLFLFLTLIALAHGAAELKGFLDAEEKMLKALDSLRMPVCAFHVDGKVSRSPVSVYIVPKAE